MIKATKQTLEAAKNFLYASARFDAWDNHDDMDDQDRWEHTFNFLVKNKVSVVEFIKEYLSDEIEKAKEEALEGYSPEEYGDWSSFDECFGVASD